MISYESHNLNPDRIVFCRLLLNQWLGVFRKTMQIDPETLLAMAIALEEVAQELRQEAASDKTPYQAPNSTGQ